MPSTTSPDAPSRVYLFAGGGTGGHIYPGLAIAEQARRLGQIAGERTECRFICSDRAIDRSILEREGVEFEPAPAKPIVLRPRALARFFWNWGPSVRLGRRAIARARAEAAAGGSRGGGVVLVAMGGFVAAPMVQAARAERCPVVLVNLDAAPGKANRWISRRADLAFSTFPVSAEFARRWTRVAPIVRAAAIDPRTPQQAREALGLDPDRLTLMVTGGSQGAGSINRFLAALAEGGSTALRQWQVLHQTGEEDQTALVQAYARVGIRAVVQRYAHPIGPWWRAADLALARAGAGSVAEAWAAGVPTLFLPYPWHKDQHQRLNALPLVEVGAAAIATDHIEAAANVQKTGPILERLLGAGSQRTSMKQALAGLGPADGAVAIAQALKGASSA